MSVQRIGAWWMVFFLLGGGAAQATLFCQIDPDTASIDPSTGNLVTKNGTHLVKTKPVWGTPGLTPPAISEAIHYQPNGKAIVFTIDPFWPVDDHNLQKLEYELQAHGPEAAGVKKPNVRFCGFAFCFDSAYTNNNGTAEPIGAQIWQCWQGRGWPPLQLRTDETNGQIRLHFVASNDDCRGSLKPSTAILPLQKGEQEIVFEKGQWYTLIIKCRFDCRGMNGEVKCWVNGDTTPAVDWKGRLGYTPTSMGGKPETNDSCDTHFGLYQSDTKTLHQIYFDRIKWADTQAEADPNTKQ